MYNATRLVLGISLGLLPAIIGCDQQDRTISHEEKVDVKSDGTVKKEQTTVKQRPDGSIVKEETETKRETQ